MATMTHLPRTYSEAREVFREHARHGRVRLGNNTTLHAVGAPGVWEHKPGDAHAYAVRLHDTDAVTFYRNGVIELSTGGYYSVTTADRMHQFTPESVRVSYRWSGGDHRLVVSVADGHHEFYTDWQGRDNYRPTFRELVTSRDGKPIYLAPDAVGDVDTFREVTERETIGATR